MRYAPLIASLIFSSCATLPNKPEVSNCLLMLELQKAACYNNKTGEEFDVPISKMNKFIAFSPKDWVKAVDYIRMLEKYRRSRVEVKKLLGSYPRRERAMKTGN